MHVQVGPYEQLALEEGGYAVAEVGGVVVGGEGVTDLEWGGGGAVGGVTVGAYVVGVEVVAEQR
ncbi:hypothetical protein [Sporisorium scitamineum]|uniref:Uncharacterized protein n=1 Tax=Sporisorium scitamineum TaxID=49012 RepID=A0A0F7S853_9BASI|nr:hypothetical protein [Sporisorium scitamineum]